MPLQESLDIFEIGLSTRVRESPTVLEAVRVVLRLRTSLSEVTPSSSTPVALPVLEQQKLSQAAGHLHQARLAVKLEGLLSVHSKKFSF